MFPSSNSSSTRDNLHYLQSPLISRCITNNCKRCDAARRAAALPLSGGRVTRGNTAAASHHLPLCWQHREWDFPGKVRNRRRITLPLTRCAFFGEKPWDGISLQENPLLTIGGEQNLAYACYWFSRNRVTECWKIEHLRNMQSQTDSHHASYHRWIRQRAA
jgi:hypothetical protein